MLKMLFLLNERRPSVIIKRVAQSFAARMEGIKDRRKALNELHKLQKPEYQMSEALKHLLTKKK